METSPRKEYFGAVVEGRFSLEDLLSVIEGLEGPSQKELYRGHEILVAGGSALSSLDSGEILIGSPQAVREMIDVREGDTEALTGPVVDAIGGLRGDPIIGASFTSPSATVLEKTRESLSETLGVPLPTAVVSDNIQVASVALYRKDEDVSVSLSLTYPDKETADTTAKNLNDAVKVAKALVSGDIRSKLLDRVKITSSKSVVHIDLTSSIADLLGQIPFVSDGDTITFQLSDGRTLGVWDIDELLKVEPQTEGGGPMFADVVNISLACKDYEDDDYEYIDACRNVPDEPDFSWTHVEVRGADRVRTLAWGQVAYLGGPFLRVTQDGTASLVDPAAGAQGEVKAVSQVIISIRPSPNFGN